MPGRRRKKKIIRVNSRRPINIDLVFFGAVAFYLCAIVYMGLHSTHIAGYEVTTGSLAANHTYTGFAIRDEKVFQAETTGYVSYYAGAGDRVTASSLVYTVDEKGDINELIQENAENIDLTDDDYSALRSEISSFMSDYEDSSFSEVYDFQEDMESSVMELLNQSMLDSLEEAGEDSMFTRVYSAEVGIVEYYEDGYEDVTADTVTEEMLDSTDYDSGSLKKEIIQAGESAYKLVQSEKWTLIVPLTSEEVSEYLEDGTEYMEVRFTRDDTTAWATFSIVYVGTTPCARLDFNNSMVRFADQRYVEVEFLVDDEEGLKIPNTAIVEKEFYLIPKDYLVEQEDSSGFLKEVYDENGQSSAEFVSVTLYYEDDDYYYIDPLETDYTSGEVLLSTGDYLVKTDSQDRFQIGQRSTLQGVYNINKGYTQFRQITILDQNEEYTLVEQGTSYGLTVYDRIVLNGEAVDEDTVIY
ncbi:MAG: hypothetical protein LIO67_07345 [Lachnospiraceae bacterium]|nr:hypothetical protein [Lachnospiraceae bacterium]